MEPARPQHRSRVFRWLLLPVALLLVIAFALAWRPAIAPIETAQRFDPALVRQGARLAAVGNCMGCHTVDAARPFAGGFPVGTPFGTIHGTNITPDIATGIGAWSLAAFDRALRRGVSRDGRHLYPAFPYDHYARLADADVHALYAYLMTRTPFVSPPVPNDLPFPLGWRPLLAGWKLLYLDRTPALPAPAGTAELRRGAYLADALAHCGACHTPRNRLGAEDMGRTFAGGEAGGWYVPALDRTSPSPMPWTADRLTAYLRNGIAPGHAIAGGPMQEVVHSLAGADEADVRAIAAYIAGALGTPPAARVADAARRAQAPTLPAAVPTDDARLRLGATVYADACARCHDLGRTASSGSGLRLPLAVALHDPDPRSLLRIVRDGIAAPDGAPGRTMPAFRGMLTEAQLAGLAAYLRRHGAGAPPWPDLETHVAETFRAAEQP